MKMLLCLRVRIKKVIFDFINDYYLNKTMHFNNILNLVTHLDKLLKDDLNLCLGFRFWYILTNTRALCCSDAFRRYKWVRIYLITGNHQIIFLNRCCVKAGYSKGFSSLGNNEIRNRRVVSQLSLSSASIYLRKSRTL